jgi:hypothetical protein
MSEPSHESWLNQAIAAYYQAVESGRPFDRDAFLAQYPDLRAELEAFLNDKAAFERRAGSPLPADETATLPPRDPGTEVPGSPKMIRYFGDYELIDEIARGGMGVVFKARQVSLNRIVAVKMILAGNLATPADVQRFRAEAEAAANLDHPNILPIYEVGEHEGQHYFSMKLIDGGSFTDRLATLRRSVRAPAELRSAVSELVKVARAVHYAHQRGIIHRDLKPSNILLDREGTPFVSDFGLAKRVEGDSGLTQSGAIVGTPSYMAPEQARAEKQLSTAVDVYSLGAVLYQCLTGRPPFQGATPVETTIAVLEREPDRPMNCDRDLATIAMKCLEKEPAKRYGSAEALAQDLERWVWGEPISARPVGGWERLLKWIHRNSLAAAWLGALPALVLRDPTTFVVAGCSASTVLVPPVVNLRRILISFAVGLAIGLVACAWLVPAWVRVPISLVEAIKPSQISVDQWFVPVLVGMIGAASLAFLLSSLAPVARNMSKRIRWAVGFFASLVAVLAVFNVSWNQSIFLASLIKRIPDNALLPVISFLCDLVLKSVVSASVIWILIPTAGVGLLNGLSARRSSGASLTSRQLNLSLAMIGTLVGLVGASLMYNSQTISVVLGHFGFPRRYPPPFDLLFYGCILGIGAVLGCSVASIFRPRTLR